ncbi:MAG: alkaline phosphatase D family protein [Pseudorhodobacter sp.]|nr:alkaline phosphatase D family protein [Rhizobacter sp.]
MTRPTALRRQLLQGVASLCFAPSLLRFALAAEVPRFALGIASGQPRASSMVHWTRLTGGNLPEQVDVKWELARDEAFTQIAARGTENAQAAWAHSVHAEPSGLEPGRRYWYRFTALGQQSPAGRTATAPAAHSTATLNFAIASCQRWDAGHFAAWRHMAQEDLDVIMFLGDYIYEYPSRPDALRRHEGTVANTLDTYRARYATYKSDPALQAAHASAPWLMVWDDHEVSNDYANLQSQDLEANFERRRAAAYQAYWEHMPFPKSARPKGPDMRITGRFDWGTLARIHLLDDRQYRDAQACPKAGRGGSATVMQKACAELSDTRRTLLGAEQEQWLADGWDSARPWNLVAQQTLMARFSWRDPSNGDATYWTDGWDGYAPARNRLLGTVADKKLKGVVVLGGDVHSNYVADLKANFDDEKSAVVATEFCGTSITSTAMAQDRIDGARQFNPHIRYARGDQRGYMRFALDAAHLQVKLRVVDNAMNINSNIATAAQFQVEASQPGAIAA